MLHICMVLKRYPLTLCRNLSKLADFITSLASPTARPIKALFTTIDIVSRKKTRTTILNSYISGYHPTVTNKPS